MNFRVVVESRAEHELRGLPLAILRRIDVLLNRLATDPRPRGVVKLKGRESEGWRIRVGTYRVLYTVDDEARLVKVYRIAHRREAFK